MNRLRTKKKVKEDSTDERKESLEETAKSAPTLKHSMTFRFGKKSAPEPAPKEELDLENALPKTDDFRTSLLMSGLSARFSMLREQDDPYTKIGKASDDSVLLPKRQSRLFDFGYASSGLCDIAEVSSIHTSLRPPAPFGLDRSNSAYSLDAEDDGGSVMSRSKPTELGGNNLFGGRQKVYKLPNGGTARNISGNSEQGSMGGRVLYDNDVAMSAFQKLREKEKRALKEQRENERRSEESVVTDRRSSSPDLSGYNHNRETTSTTDFDSSLTRSSTAATSVGSFRTPSTRSPKNPLSPTMVSAVGDMALDRSNTKTRRLYETGLDQHMQAQQFSAMSRLDSISRQRTFEPNSAHSIVSSPVPNTFDLPEVLEEEATSQAQGRGLSTSTRSTSFDLSSEKPEETITPTIAYEAPPLSPPLSDGGDVSSLPIDPRDRGKATAEMTFSKPAQPYDDQKYVQRQLQMHTGGIASTLRRDIQKPSQAQRCGSAESVESGNFDQFDMTKLSSTGGTEVIKRQKLPPTLRNPASTTELCHIDVISPPFSSNDDGSIYPEDEVKETRNSSTTTMPLQISSGNIAAPFHAAKPPDAEHPAIRKQSAESFDIDSMRPGSRDNLSSMKSSSDYRLSPDPASDLRGMVRQHLRSYSNASSIYDTPSFESPARVSYDESKPTLTDKTTLCTDPQANQNPVASSSPLLRSTVMNEYEDVTYDVLSEDIYQPGHRRDTSTATQKERAEFHNALAARRRRVQENLRSFIDPDSAANSPVIVPQPLPRNVSHRGHQISDGMLRSTTLDSQTAGAHSQPGWRPPMIRPGRDGPKNLPGRVAPHSDGLRHGLQAIRDIPRSYGSTTNEIPHEQSRQPYSQGLDYNQMPPQQRRRMADNLNEPTERMQMARGSPRENHREPRPLQQMPRNGSRPRVTDYKQAVQERRAQDTSYGHRVRSPSVKNLRRLDERAPNSPEPHDRPASRSTSRNARSRSNSELSGTRSQSRTGRYRDDLARAMAEGTASSAQTTIEELPETKTCTDHPAILPPNHHGNVPPENASGHSDVVGLGLFAGQIPSVPLNSPGFRSPRPSPMTPSHSHAAKSPASSQSSLTASIPRSNSGAQGDAAMSYKRSIKKAEISEPTFVSSTARMATVELSEVAPLKGLNIGAPPLPTVNPRRHQTRIQTIFGLPEETVSSSVTLGNGGAINVAPNRAGKLRKSSSEGGNLRSRAQAAFDASPTPAMPQSARTPPINIQEGGMF